MTAQGAPPVVPWSYQSLVDYTEELLQRYSQWRPPPAGERDLASVLVRIFARLAELAANRINLTPDRNFIAFLNLLGIELRPPQPARVPLTFSIASGRAEDAFVPAGTRVAAATPGEPVVFETERDLVVTHTELIAAFTRDPSHDLYAVNTNGARGQDDQPFAIFVGDPRQPIEHILYIGDARLLKTAAPVDVTIHVQPCFPQDCWLAAVQWTAWDGAVWRPLSAAGPPMAGSRGWQVVLRQIPPLPALTLSGVSSAWIRCQLATRLPRGEIDVDPVDGQTILRGAARPADTACSEDVPVDPTGEFYPFGEVRPVATFYLACTEAFGKPGAIVELHFDLDPERPAEPSQLPPLSVTWEYVRGEWDTEQQSWHQLWKALTDADDLNDSTRGLSESGSVMFRCPAQWSAGTAADGPAAADGLWLRARIISGNFGVQPMYRPPVVQHLTVQYTWRLPRLSNIELETHIGPRDGLRPDAAFADHLPIDLSKAFLPFGEKPKLNDTMYLACDEAFALHEAGQSTVITLDIEPTSTEATQTPPRAAPTEDLLLIWEFWDAQQRQWATLGESRRVEHDGAPTDYGHTFADTTGALVNRGSITFIRPASQGTVEVNGISHAWIRARIARGAYGAEAHYQALVGTDGQEVPFPGTTMPIYQLVPATFRPPSLASVSITHESTSAPTQPAHIVLENDFAITEVYPAEAGRSGLEPFVLTADTRPTLYLGFDRPAAGAGFANSPTDLFFSIRGAAPGDVPIAAHLAEPVVVSWQYWDGQQWQRLGARDQTTGFTTRGLLTFVGPADFERSTQFRIPAFWLRARWESGQYSIIPRLARVLTNTMWASHTLTVADETLGSANGSTAQVMRTTHYPVLDGERIEVRELELPSNTEREIIESEEGSDAITTITDRGGQLLEIWVRWHRVDDFYASGPRSRHYRLDRLTGELTFGDGQCGLVPPPGRANVRAARYQTGGGERGNCAPRTINQLKSTVPYVDSVVNLEAADGGTPQEDLANVKVRGPKILRHGNRAVALVDFEDLALDASGEVARARAIPADTAEGAGQVLVVVVPKSTDAKPVPGLELIQRVEQHLSERCAPTVDLLVQGPCWLCVTVTAEVVPVSPDRATDVQKAVLGRLAAFLHPLTGGLDNGGWAFGRKPYRSDLYALIAETPGVDHVQHLSVDEVADAGAPADAAFLVYSGAHQITMVGAVGLT